jgi:hypothetical protein
VTQRGPFLFLVALLLLAGIGTAAFRQQEFRIPWLPGAQQTVWEVEARVEYLAQGVPTQAFLTLPPNQNGFRLIRGTPASTFGFGLNRQGSQERAHWAKRHAEGEQVLFYKLQLVKDSNYRVDTIPPGPRPVVVWDEPYQTAAQQIIQAALPISADARTLAQQLINNMNLVPSDQNVSLLRERYSDPVLLTRLLVAAGVTARTVQVLELEDGRRRQALRDYAQVWDGERWYLFNPASGPVTDLDNLLLWKTDTPAVLEIIGGTRSSVSFSMISHSRSMLALAETNTPDMGFSLYSLPIAEQGMFKLIMLLPVGALVVVFMRVVIGVRTAGTFMPVLIALAFLQTQLLPGLASFILVVTVGLLIRSYLSALNLLLVARIAILIIVVIGIISVFSVISYRMGLLGGLTITFFPMVILAWTIERMSIIWEEEGPREVLIQGGGSLLVAVFAFLLMDLDTIRHLAFNFPELHLSVLALVMLLGRYTGYRLLELRRFVGLSEP